MNAASTIGDQRRPPTRASTGGAGAPQRRQVSIRALGEDEWRLYRSLLAEVARDAPDLVPDHSHNEEMHGEREWRSLMVAAHRLVAEQDGAAVGVVSVGTHSKEPSSADLTGLWVARAARNGGIGTCLVEAAAAIGAGDGKKQMYYWVGTENASAIAFASNTGFRVTSYRRGARNDDQPQGQEVAFVMPLEPDPGTVPNASPTP